MDYEKKYKEALEHARAEILANPGLRKTWEDIFPELRESEDERVIRTLYYLVRDHDWLNGATKGEALTWLEKQKEQKPVECSEVELEFRGEKVTVKRPFYRDDKGRGYSTAELDEGVAWNALRAWCEKKGISLYDLYPKAEWSEEDEKMRNLAIEWAETMSGQFRFVDMGSTDFRKIVAWLKSLRPSWKPSGQDELMKLKYAGTSTKLD